MANFEVKTTTGPKIIKADIVRERNGALHFEHSDGGFVAAVAPGHWSYFGVVEEEPQAKPPRAEFRPE